MSTECEKIIVVMSWHYLYIVLKIYVLKLAC